MHLADLLLLPLVDWIGLDWIALWIIIIIIKVVEPAIRISDNYKQIQHSFTHCYY